MKFRAFGFFCLLAALGSGGVAEAGHIHFAAGPQAVEHLVRHADMLVTDINLTRANGFRVAPVVVETIVARPSWLANIYGDLIVVERGRTADFYIGRHANNFRMEVISFYEFFTQVGPSPQLTNQFLRMNWAYINAMAATYTYIESLRRGYLLPGAPLRCRDRALLIRRLRTLERVAFEIRELMHLIRHIQAFNFPLSRNCIECSFGRFRIDIEAQTAIDVTFPYYVNNRAEFPDTYVPRVAHPDRFTPYYSVDYWNQRWDYIDQGYLNPGADRTRLQPPPSTIDVLRPFPVQPTQPVNPPPPVAPVTPQPQPQPQPAPGTFQPGGFDY